MAGQSSNPIPAMTTPQPVVVIGPQFLAPNPVNLKVVSKFLNSLRECNDLSVTDMNANLIFKVKSKSSNNRDRRYLLDAANKILATFQTEAHRTWRVFRGGSTNTQDLLFSVEKLFQSKLITELDVFLAANTAENVPDFKVKGDWMGRSYAVYLGQSNTIIAQMRRNHTFSVIVFDSFSVTSCPNVDYAFIVSLVLILWDCLVTSNPFYD